MCVYECMCIWGSLPFAFKIGDVWVDSFYVEEGQGCVHHAVTQGEVQHGITRWDTCIGMYIGIYIGMYALGRVG